MAETITTTMNLHFPPRKLQKASTFTFLGASDTSISSYSSLHFHFFLLVMNIYNFLLSSDRSGSRRRCGDSVAEEETKYVVDPLPLVAKSAMVVLSSQTQRVGDKLHLQIGVAHPKISRFG